MILILFLVLLPLLAHFFEDFPNGWDQAEYCCGVKYNLFPHSPYILFFLAGKLASLIWRPPVALALLSLLSGLAAAGLFYSILRRGEARREYGSFAAVAGTFLFACSYLFIRQTTSQEVYAFHTVWLLAAVWAAWRPHRRAALYGGVAAGLALAAHSATVFVLPALAYAWWINGAHRRWRALATGLAALAVTAGLTALIIYQLLPPQPDADRWRAAGHYLRGLSPLAPVAPRDLTQAETYRNSAALLWQSAARMYLRLVDLNIPHTRPAIATGPLGLSPWHLAAAALGAALALIRRRPWAVFWLLYGGVYAAYEAVKSNPDVGAYLPFVLPPLIAFLLVAVSEASAGCLRCLKGPGPAGTGRASVGILVAASCLAFSAPSLRLVAAHWRDVADDRRLHYSATVCAAMWIAEHRPADTVVVLSRREWNPNVIPYYLRRPRYVMLLGREWLLFRNRGAFTPMNLNSFTPLTTAQLTEWIADGVAVYAFESNPFKDQDDDRLDPRRFRWEAEQTIDLAEIDSTLARWHGNAARAPAIRLPLYRCRPAESAAN
jgi:hypothetical protein